LDNEPDLAPPIARAWRAARRFLDGEGRSTHLLPRWLFLRMVGVGFAANFLSLATQVHGLVGPSGILPAREWLDTVAAADPPWLRLVDAPSLLWLGASDRALDLLVWGGFASSLLVVINRLPRLGLALCWLLYLSFLSTARAFSGFQSDGLMLECAVVGLLLAPRGFRPRLGGEPSRLALFCGRFLAFRLVFEAGAAKLVSHDPSWRALTALTDYYENCPFPSRIGWWAANLPRDCHVAAALFTLLVELSAPLIALGRRPRALVAGGWIALQLGILATASYTFLNGAAIAIGFLLLDDRMLCGRDLPSERPRRRPIRSIAAIALASVWLLVSTAWLLPSFGGDPGELPAPLALPVELLHPLRSANRYALFAAMTHERLHIEFVGMRAGQPFRVYPLRWQPQRLDGAPRAMAPHLPRFDWNLWFAVLDDAGEHPFVARAAERLLDGDREVLALFAADPFAGSPPDEIRVLLFRWKFTDAAARARTGAYWQREYIGEYEPPTTRVQ